MDEHRSKGSAEGLGDDQGTRVGAPDQSTPRQRSDAPTGRPERKTGAGSEATEGQRADEPQEDQHRSGYGGAGGKPVTSSDEREGPHDG
jgi:hypothetical protein